MPAEVGQRRAASPALIVGAIAVVLVAQVYLVFAKSINWDEFLHLSQLHDLRGGRLVHAFQMLHTYIYYWVPLVTDDVIRQIQVIRLGMLGFELVTIASIYGLARRFASVEASLLASLAYVGGGHVFLHGFAVRPDPIATAMLMSALYLAATQRLRVPMALAIATLIGLSGAATIKATLYLPCFAGIAWWRYVEAEDRKQVIRALVVAAVVAPLVFALLIYLHSLALAPQAPSVGNQPLRGQWMRFFAEGLFPRGIYLVREIMMAPLLAATIAFAPAGWKRCGVTGAKRIALWGLMLPLLSLIIYRNAFPYYFVFLLAPVVVAAAPAIQLAVQRYDYRFILAVLLASPLILAVKEPREYLGPQRAIIDQVHRMYPAGTPYLSYSGIISDYRRIVPILTSGVGMATYHRNGQAIIAREFERGRLPFIIGDHVEIHSALIGHPMPDTFLPADLAVMRDNYFHFWGPIWLEGKQLPGGQTSGEIAVERGGHFTVADSPAEIDGQPVAVGEAIVLSPGKHRIAGPGDRAPVLWRGTSLPQIPPAEEPSGPVYTDF